MTQSRHCLRDKFISVVICDFRLYSFRPLDPKSQTRTLTNGRHWLLCLTLRLSAAVFVTMIPVWIMVTYTATDNWRAITWHTQKGNLQKAQSLISSRSRRRSWESIPHADRDHKLRKSSIFIYIHVLQLYSHIVIAVMQDDFTYTHLNLMPIYFILAVLHTNNTGSDDFVNQK